jgi:putative endonuclease
LMYIVYAIKSRVRNYIYVGMTNDLYRRLNEHNQGFNKSTKPYIPFSIIYFRSFDTRQAARFHEKYLKSGSGKESLKKLL